MANHKSALKRIRSNDAKRLTNRYQAKSTRTAMKKLRTSTDKKEAATLLPKVSSMLDKLAKTGLRTTDRGRNSLLKAVKVFLMQN
ncbi:MAG: 30S ribosomal protein S20 [Bacteroidetes bacterium]|nr:30S ribosomal protein S20 [Bacteroidota bacterium]